METTAKKELSPLAIAFNEAVAKLKQGVPNKRMVLIMDRFLFKEVILEGVSFFPSVDRENNIIYLLQLGKKLQHRITVDDFLEFGLDASKSAIELMADFVEETKSEFANANLNTKQLAKKRKNAIKTEAVTA